MHFNLTTSDRQAQADARDAALSPVDGPCCEPMTADPCVACLAPDIFPDEPFVPILEDVAVEPTEADLEWYRGLCRERAARLWDERIAADEDRAYREMQRAEADGLLLLAVREALKAPNFQAMIDGFANAFADHVTDDVRAVGLWIGGRCDEVRAVEAKSADQFRDRYDAVIDSRF